MIDIVRAPSTDNERHEPKTRFWLGTLCALLSAVAFSLNMVLAGLSYQHGANIHSLNLARAAAFLCCLFAMILITRASLHMPVRARLASLAVGVLLCGEMYVLLGAIQTIPVALAVLIFYTYPILIALYGWLRRGERFSMASVLLLGLAFAGLVIVLIDAPVTPDLMGMVFSVAAAIIMAAMLITSEYSLNRHNNYVVLGHALTIVTLIIAGLALTVMELHWPTTDIGWIIFSGSTVFYVIATFLLFKAVGFFGPLRTAIVDNTAPVWAMLFGYFLLQQFLNPLQVMGAFVVVISVMLLQWLNKPDSHRL